MSACDRKQTSEALYSHEYSCSASVALAWWSWVRRRLPDIGYNSGPTFAVGRTVRTEKLGKSCALGNDAPASPRNVRKGPWAVGPAGFEGIAHSVVGARSLSGVERRHIPA